MSVGITRRRWAAGVAWLLAGCAGPREFHPSDLPPWVPLQDAPDGKAIVYLLRAPHDSAVLPVFFGDRKVAMLPPATYSVAVVEPGTHVVASAPSSGPARSPALALTVLAGERRFVYASGVNARRWADGGVLPFGRTGLIPLPIQQFDSAGPRVWTECTELDAQGLMSIARPVPPEPGAA